MEKEAKKLESEGMEEMLRQFIDAVIVLAIVRNVSAAMEEELPGAA